MSNHNKETEARCFHCYRHYVEGTAAWALYMMRMGRKVTNPKDDPRVYYLPEGGMIQVDGMEIIAGNQWIDYWCIDIPDGWQIYNELEPKFKVGDWVEIEVSGVLSQQQTTSGVFADSIKCGGVEFYANGNPVMQPLNARIIRKLSGCEVKVKVTLEGTVRKSQLNGCFVLDTPMPGNDVHTIRLVELDPNTAELVKALLKEQEEK